MSRVLWCKIVDKAIQTISWGRNVPLLINDMPKLADIGYMGLELAQTKFDIPDFEGFLQAVENSKMQIVGVAGGNIEEKVDMVTRIRSALPGESTPYIYMDHWDERHQKRFELKKDALDYSGEIRIAIHPHMFKPVQNAQDLKSVFEQFESLKFLPDTAHLTVAGEDVVELVRKYSDRLVGIHLKNWLPAHGRSFQFYSKGFCGLADENGTVPLNEIIMSIRGRNQGNWIIEQDYSANPIISARKSLEWLAQKLGA